MSSTLEWREQKTSVSELKIEQLKLSKVNDRKQAEKMYAEHALNHNGSKLGSSRCAVEGYMPS